MQVAIRKLAATKPIFRCLQPTCKVCLSGGHVRTWLRVSTVITIQVQFNMTYMRVQGRFASLQLRLGQARPQLGCC